MLNNDMETLKNIINWPHKKGNCYAPLYLMAWRILWFVPLWISILFTTGVVFCSFGPRQAKDFFKSTL